MKKPSQQQQKIIDFNGQNLLVSASAGSGKTETVINRIARLIIDRKATIKEILLSTFTVAAADEMRSRLVEELKQYSNDAFVMEQINQIFTADIGTLHSFCQKIIKQNFYKINIDPSFALASEDDIRFLKIRCLDKVIDVFSHEDKDFFKVIDFFASRRDTIKMKNCIMSFYDFYKSVDKDFLNIALKGYSLDLNNNVICIYLNNYFNHVLCYYKSSFEEYLKQSIKIGCKTLEDFLKSVLSDFDFVGKDNSFTQNIYIINNLDIPAFSKKKIDEEHNVFKEILKQEWTGFKLQLKSIKSFVESEQQIKDGLENSQWYAQKMIELLLAFEKEYKQQKIDKNILDFNDLEEFACELLEDEEIREKIQKQYKYIFIDEYQDINTIQEKILNKIATNNQTMVGDIKQSIYGFRNSTPQIFLDKMQAYAQGEGCLLDLSKNYRSNVDILSFVNEIFSKIMTKQTAGIDYIKHGMFNIDSSSKKDCRPAVQVNIINQAKDEEENEESLDEVSSAQMEARLVANKISELIDSCNKDGKEFKYSDILILSRSRGDFLKTFVSELASYRLPVIASLKEKMYDNNDINLLVNFLKIISSTNDDIAWTSWLTSSFVGISYDELCKVRKDIDNNIFANIKTYITEKDDKISLKLKSFLEKVEKIRFFASFNSIYKILTEIDRIFGYSNYCLSLPDGENRYYLVCKFIESFLSTEYNDNLEGYLYYVDNYAKESLCDFSMFSNENSIKVDTIHSSKGLGEKNIFLIGSGRMFNFGRNQSETVYNIDLGLGVNCFDYINNVKKESLVKKAIKKYVRDQEIAEEMRLLYVALTRAKEKLIIVGSIDKNKLKPLANDFQVKQCNNYLGWICSSFSDNCFNHLENGTSFTEEKENGRFEVCVYAPDSIMINKPEKRKVEVKPLDKQIEKAIDNYLHYNYDDSSTDIALKNSVTSLMAEQEVGQSFNNFPTKLSIFESSVLMDQGAKIGTCYHKVMEAVDFNSSLNDVEKLIDNMSKEDANIKKYVDTNRIYEAIQQVNKLGKKFLKEKKFLAYIPHKNLVQNSIVGDKVLVQGVIDLVVLGDENIIVDYKTTKVSSEKQLLEKYKVQLEIYKQATEKALNVKIDEVYIYSFVLGKLVKMQ